MRCREPGCNKEIIWTKTANGSWMPIDYNSVSDEEIMLLAQGITLNYNPAIHINHWGTCTNPNHFKKKKDDTSTK